MGSTLVFTLFFASFPLMINRLPHWLFLSLAMFLMGFALFPVIRALIGIDEEIGIQFLTVVYFLIGGLMCGLTAMILMVRRQPIIARHQNDDINGTAAAAIHATGLLIFTGIPLANFLACYFLWLRVRHRSAWLDYQGREALCFQITLYLYLLMALLMVIAIVGIFAIPVLLLFHFVTTLIAMIVSSQGKWFRYPANINIVERQKADKTSQAQK